MKNENNENNWFRFKKSKIQPKWSIEETDKNDDNQADSKEQWNGMHIEHTCLSGEF